MVKHRSPKAELLVRVQLGPQNKRKTSRILLVWTGGKRYTMIKKEGGGEKIREDEGEAIIVQKMGVIHV